MAIARLYFIRRLKNLGASVQTLRESYILFVRPILEMCAPLFAGALHIKTGKSLSESLERVQRNFCKILLPNKDYLSSLNELDLSKISERRLKLTKKFGYKMASNPKCAYLFPKVPKSSTRSTRKFLEPKWKSNHYSFSTIPFCIRLLNGEIKI